MQNKDRVGIMERRRALETARNMINSKIGKVVLSENKFPDRTLQIQVKQIDAECKKNQTIIDNDKKTFKRGRLIYNLEPTIIMERPASPILNHVANVYSDNADTKPHYMTEIKKQKPFISEDMPPTIDAFTVLRRKTKNLWETNNAESDLNKQFRSIIMKSPTLLNSERDELGKEYERYRPPSKSEVENQEKIRRKKRVKLQMLQDAQRTPSPDPVLVFITQLEQEAASRQSKRQSSGNSTRDKFFEGELNFNSRHLEVFEKIRSKQKTKYFNTLKME